MTIIVAVALAGIFAGIAVHQRVDLREARSDLSAYQDNEVHQAEAIGGLRAQVRSHEISLTMLMDELRGR